jgi:hypothetical protein
MCARARTCHCSVHLCFSQAYTLLSQGARRLLRDVDGAEPFSMFVFRWLIRTHGSVEVARSEGARFLDAMCRHRAKNGSCALPHARQRLRARARAARSRGGARGAGDLFARFLDGSLSNSHLALVLCIRRALAATPFGMEYPSPHEFGDPEYVCAVKASMVARAIARLMRCGPHSRVNTVGLT